MKTEIIYFSATNTTEALVKAISQGLSGSVCFSNVTLPKARNSYVKIDSDLTIIATPIYGERIPRFLYDFFQQLTGNGKPLVVVSVYGNMGFGISLMQFQQFAIDHNFTLIAAGALIGQHTYATKKAPVAYGRPDKLDLEQAHIFGEALQRKIDLGDSSPITVPATSLPKFITEFPDAGTRLFIRQPRVKNSLCNACGVCARACPTGAINPHTLKINEHNCLRCYACAKICPKAARVTAFRLQVFNLIFSFIGRKRKENHTFL